MDQIEVDLEEMWVRPTLYDQDEPEMRTWDGNAVEGGSQ